MLTDSERFAFVPRRLHSFATTGNAYDACQCDDAITKGDTLIVLSEGVVGLAWAWPIAVTAEHGNLHTVDNRPDTTLGRLATDISMTPEDIAHAVAFARVLGFTLDPQFERLCPLVPGASPHVQQL